MKNTVVLVYLFIYEGTDFECIWNPVQIISNRNPLGFSCHRKFKCLFVKTCVRLNYTSHVQLTIRSLYLKLQTFKLNFLQARLYCQLTLILCWSVSKSSDFILLFIPGGICFLFVTKYEWPVKPDSYFSAFSVLRKLLQSSSSTYLAL